MSLILLDIVPVSLQNFGQEIGNAWPIILALIFLAGLVRWSWKKLIAEVKSEITEVRSEITPIKEEVKHNHGSSMKDSLVRLEGDVRVMHGQLEINNTILAELRRESITSGQRFKHIVRSLPVGIFEADIDGKYKWVNRTWTELTGVTMMDALDDGWEIALLPEEAIFIKDEWYRACKEKRAFGPVKHRVINQESKHEVWVISEAMPLLDEYKEVLGFIGNMSHITA